MDSSKHTAGKWYVTGVSDVNGDHLHIGSPESMMVLASLNARHVQTKANADFIVTACNAYESLLRALELADSIMDYSRGDAYEREGTQKEYDEFVELYRQLVPREPEPMAEVRPPLQLRQPRMKCPECGQKCGGEQGLAAHARAKHSLSTLAAAGAA